MGQSNQFICLSIWGYQMILCWWDAWIPWLHAYHLEKLSKAWAQSYKGKENTPSIVLEGISDYHMIFWHASYGYASTLNENTIYDLSPILEMYLSKFWVRSSIKCLYLLMEFIWIYIDLWIVKGIKIALTNAEAKYINWQEAIRKDIEHAFGNLKILWKFVCCPIEIWSLNDIEDQITTFCILTNIVVADWVMGNDPNVQYNPSKTIKDHGDFSHVAQTPYPSLDEKTSILTKQLVDYHNLFVTVLLPMGNKKRWQMR